MLDENNKANDNQVKSVEIIVIPISKLRSWAYRKINKAILNGVLIRPTICPICEVEYNGTKRTDVIAHHHDYCQPLDVKWMCRRCHNELHIFDINDKHKSKAFVRVMVKSGVYIETLEYIHG